MKLKTTLAALLFCATALASSPHKYRLVWQDDFNGTTFDNRSWTKISRGSADWRRYMSDAVLRGALNTNLEADTARFVTGGLYTKRKHAVRYGKVEVRARFDCAQGVWPAIWMKPDYEVKWPHGGEIDIMEHLNHDNIAYQTIHTTYTHTLKQDQILPDSIVFSVNGQPSFSYPRIEELKDKDQYPFGAPFYLLIDMQIEGSWVGKADPKQLPVEMEIDWVKLYELEKEK